MEKKKYYSYEIWNDNLADCYHEEGIIECASDTLYETEEEAEAAAQREIKELEETTNEFGYYSVVKEMKIKKHKGK